MKPKLLAYGAAILVSALFAIALLGIPIQISDSLTEFLTMQAQTFRDVVRDEFFKAGPFFRPGKRVTIKLLFDLSGGNFYWWYRGFHALEFVILAVLFVWMLRPKTITTASLVPLALAMIAGSHLNLDIFREAFPVQHFLTIVIFAVAAVILAQSRGGWLVDAGSALLLAVSMLTIESGLLIWVVFVAAYAVGYRGVSRRAVVALTCLFAFYFVYRFVWLRGGVPAIGERDTGFLLSNGGAAEVRQRFGNSPWVLYAYNFVSAITCVLFAEPRAGTLMFTRAMLADNVQPWQVLTVATSTLTTLVIAWYVVTRIRTWRIFNVPEDDRLVAVFLVLLPANAAFDIVYEKDVVLSVAGIFHVAAATIALKRLLEIASLPSWRSAIAYATILLVACGWSMRAIGTQYRLREVASINRNDWAYWKVWLGRQDTVSIDTPGEKRVFQVLYDDAIWRRPAPPAIESRFWDRWSDPEE
jgi:hypothetical protein